MKTKVSVILPSLNVADYIGQAVDSVMRQTLENIEIICVDAGSTDGTEDILRELAGKDSRISIIHAEKKSYGYQMNLGISRALGDYIGIVETDDFVEPEMFEYLYKGASVHCLDVIKAMLVEEYDYGKGGKWSREVTYIPESIPINVEFNPDDCRNVHICDGNIWNGIYRREFLIENEIWFNETPGASYQDIGFQQMVLNLAKSMMYVDRFFYHYRVIRPGSSTWNVRCVRNIYNEYYRLLNDDRIKATHLDYIYARMFPAFLYEYDKALRYAGYDESRLECPEGVEWFSERALYLLQNSDFAQELLGDYNSLNMIRFLNRRAYIDGRRRWQNTVAECIDTYIYRVKKKGWVLFGCGKYGWSLLFFQIRNGCIPVAVTDNNKDLWGEDFHGFTVAEPEKTVKQYCEAIYLIANKKSQDEIKKQLLSYNISEDNIVSFDGSDTQLMRIIREAPMIY